MIKDITIGQYFPGESFIHKLDPRTKILVTMAYIIALFFVKSFWGFLIAFVFMLSVVLISKISIKLVLRGLKPLIFIILFTAVFNLFYGNGTPIFPQVAWLSFLTYDGLISAAFMVVRIFLLIVGSSFMTYTTSPVMLTDAIERLMFPLKFLKVPIHDLAMMMTIALRFIPTLVDETNKIINAQKARGADFETGGLIKRAKALIPVLIPLLISAFRRAEELAYAMECRCYNGNDGRTRYKRYKFSYRDLIATVIFVAVATAAILV